MKWDEIQHHLEPDNIGTAPMAIKGGVFAFLFVAIIAAGYLFRYHRSNCASSKATKERKSELKGRIQSKGRTGRKTRTV